MQDIRPFLEKRFEDILRKKKKEKICVTVSWENEDNMFALTRFHRYDNYSKLVDNALTEYFQRNEVAKDLDKARNDWRTLWDLFRKKRT